jgi:hypothetical protein
VIIIEDNGKNCEEEMSYFTQIPATKKDSGNKRQAKKA